MKKNFFQVSVIIALALVLVSMAFMVQGNGAGMAGGTVCPMVGWNTGPARCGGLMANNHGFAFQIVLPPDFYNPNVGWNS